MSQLALAKFANADVLCYCVLFVSDLADQRQVESEEAKTYADENNILFLETSAKTNHMVNEMFKTIAVKLPKSTGGAAGQRQSGNIVVNPEDNDPAKNDKKGGCC